MTNPRRPRSRPSPGLAEIRLRLAEAEETLRAIRTGEVDTVSVAGRQGPRVFTLEGAEHAYRVLIESMNEGALTLAADKTILYANACFARMVKCPLEQVTGSSFRRFLSLADQAALRPHVQNHHRSGDKIQVRLIVRNGPPMPAQISIRRLARSGSSPATIGMVVTDMTEARRNEEMLRELSHRVVQGQETERGRVALELHDHITQLLCAILVRSQALVATLPKRNLPSKREAMKLLELLSETAGEVERISRDLRPGVLDQLGLAAVLHETSTEFARRTGVLVKLVCPPFARPLAPEIELSLYRILQEALKNVEQHGHARHVTVRLTQPGDLVELAIDDDGVGFNPVQLRARRSKNGNLGLLAMRERANSMGGSLEIRSGRRAGTAIVVRIPLPEIP